MYCTFGGRYSRFGFWNVLCTVPLVGGIAGLGSGMFSSSVASSAALLWNMLALQDVGAAVVALDICEVWKDAIASSFRL